LERDKAENFRCIISEHDFKEFAELADDNFRDFQKAYFYSDDDYYCFDYFHRFLGAAENEVLLGHNANFYRNALVNIHKKIKHESANNADEKIRSKYLWMERYFNKTVYMVKKYGKPNEYLWL